VHLAGKLEESSSGRRRDEREQSIGSVAEMRGEAIKGGGVRLAETKKNFLDWSGELTEVIEAG